MSDPLAHLKNITPNQGPRINLKLSDTSKYLCSCGNGIFTEGLILRQISPLIIGNSNQGVVPYPRPVIYCVSCLKPVKELLPPELQDEPVEVEVSQVISD